MAMKKDINEIKEQLKDISEIKEQLGKITEKLSILDTLEETAKTQLNRINGLEEQINNLGENVKEVTESQNFISEQYDDQRNTINNVLNQNKELKSKNEELTAQLIDANKNIVKLHDEINDLEQYGQRIMLEIYGIPKTKNENTNKIAEQIANKLKVDLNENDIDVSHRLSNAINAGIIVKFTSWNKCEEILEKAKKAKLKCGMLDLGTEYIDEFENKENTQNKFIFVNESLTKTNKIKLSKTRELLKNMLNIYG